MNKRITNKIDKWMNGPNEKNIIRHIMSNENVSRTDISKSLAVSMSTVTNVTEKLLSKELIKESGIQKTVRGRSIKLLEVNQEKFKAIGIGINLLVINVSLIDFNGKKYYHKEIPLDTVSWKNNYENIIVTLDELLQTHSDCRDDILGIGIEPPGFVEFNMKNLDSTFEFEDEWNVDGLIATLEERYEFGVTYSSSFSCILSGETFFGNARYYDNVINVNVSSVGLGWAKIDHRIIDKNVAASYRSIGHMMINMSGPKCPVCGQNGCVEIYTGKEALVNNYQKLIAIEEDFHRPADGEVIDYHKILEYAENGDFVAVQAVTKAATILGTALGNMASMLHPDMIILTGRIIRESHLYFEMTKKVINDRLKNLIEKEVVVELATIHKFNTTSFGAATLVFVQIFLGE